MGVLSAEENDELRKYADSAIIEGVQIVSQELCIPPTLMSCYAQMMVTQCPGSTFHVLLPVEQEKAMQEVISSL